MKVLKYGVYHTMEGATQAINEKVYPNPRRSLVQIVHVADTFLGASTNKFVVWYNEEEKEDES